MNFLKRLGTFWVILIGFGILGYVCAFNLEWIYVNIPHVGEFKMRAGIVYLACFILGVSFTVVFFGLDSVKKSLEVHQRNKKIAKLEKKIESLSGIPATSTAVEAQSEDTKDTESEKPAI